MASDTPQTVEAAVAAAGVPTHSRNLKARDDVVQAVSAALLMGVELVVVTKSRKTSGGWDVAYFAGLE